MENKDVGYWRALVGCQKLNKEQKLAIEQAAVAYGITINKRCGNCYKDAAVMIYDKLRREEQKLNGVGGYVTEGGYSLKAGTDFYLISGREMVRVNERNLTDENAAMWLRLGIDKKYFATMPDSNADNGAD